LETSFVEKKYTISHYIANTVLFSVILTSVLQGGFKRHIYKNAYAEMAAR